ncbi:MAG: carbamoyltransferase C-terminal domain-containing protein [Bacteroidales bacterium]|nr:carbamoyltransferase C-terminal domain-containing protein [Bacteroidales bacterium]
MYILGINGGVRAGYQDISASLLYKGSVIAAVEEERLNRIKFSPGQLPELSIHQVLKMAGISIHDVSYVASHGSTWGQEYADKLQSYFKFTFGHCPPLAFVHHHDAHAAGAFYGSGFDEAMVITIDGSGDGVSTQLAIGKGLDIKIMERFSRPDSLGIFYSMITQFCGFKRDSDEYKLMGLAPYGNPEAYDMTTLLSYGNGRYKVDDSYLRPIPHGQSQPIRQEMMFGQKLIDMFGPYRLKGAPIEQNYKDIAASAQKHLEDVIVDLVTAFHKRTGLRKLCLAGGVALNCLVNQKLMNLDFIDDFYVMPASSDAGISMGAAMYIAAQNGFKTEACQHVFLGNNYTNDDILSILKATNINYKEVNPIEKASEYIENNKVIAWFQGGMEFGPRALGARSILSNPGHPGMKDILNYKIKFRESYRPFCPSVTEEDAMKYFSGKKEVSPYMTITYDVKEGMGVKIPAVTHVNNTARIQTVNASQNKLYYELLLNLKKITGHAVVINTSFNTNNEPIVCSPFDALATFHRSGIDALFIGDFLVEK